VPNTLLNDGVKVTRPISATAAGATAVNGTALDMTGFVGIRFVALLGTLTGTQVTSLKAQQGALSDGSDAVDIAGAVTAAAADGDGNKLLILDVAKSLITARYVRPVVNRSVANAVVDGVIAEQYKAGTEPVTATGTTVSAVKSAY